MYKDVAFFDANRTGDMISRLNSDIQVVEHILGSSLSIMLRTGVFILGTLIIMIVISPALAGVTFGGVIPLTIVSNVY